MNTSTNNLNEHAALQCRDISELKYYEKVGVLGHGSFGKVYLLRLRHNEKKTSANKTTYNVNDHSKSIFPRWFQNEEEEYQLAAKIQRFDDSPLYHRREASILKQLVNNQV